VSIAARPIHEPAADALRPAVVMDTVAETMLSAASVMQTGSRGQAFRACASDRCTWAITNHSMVFAYRELCINTETAVQLYGKGDGGEGNAWSCRLGGRPLPRPGGQSAWRNKRLATGGNHANGLPPIG
jgi:hypothetical protein